MASTLSPFFLKFFSYCISTFNIYLMPSTKKTKPKQTPQNPTQLTCFCASNELLHTPHPPTIHPCMHQTWSYTPTGENERTLAAKNRRGTMQCKLLLCTIGLMQKRIHKYKLGLQNRVTAKCIGLLDTCPFIFQSTNTKQINLNARGVKQKQQPPASLPCRRTGC